MKTKKYCSLDMCSVHWPQDAKKKNSNMELIQTLVLQPISSSTKKCISVHDAHFQCKWLISSTHDIYIMGRKTDAFTWPSLLRHLSKWLLNLSTWEQPLLPVLDVFGMGWVIKRPSQGAAAEMLPKTYDPTYSSWTLRGLVQTRPLSLSS